MAYTDPTYVIFDGDNDAWAYRFMKGWKANERVDFDFRDAHDLDNMTGRAQDEAYVKKNLRERMKNSSAVLVLVGEKTKNLYKYIRWELELALEMGLPIIVANLNELRTQDGTLCPAIIRDKCVVHIPFKLAAIKNALNLWPSEFGRMDSKTKAGGFRTYSDDILRRWGAIS